MPRGRDGGSLSDDLSDDYDTYGVVNDPRKTTHANTISTPFSAILYIFKDDEFGLGFGNDDNYIDQDYILNDFATSDSYPPTRPPRPQRPNRHEFSRPPHPTSSSSAIRDHDPYTGFGHSSHNSPALQQPS